jgi:hypothetical protein
MRIRVSDETQARRRRRQDDDDDGDSLICVRRDVPLTVRLHGVKGWKSGGTYGVMEGSHDSERLCETIRMVL